MKWICPRVIRGNRGDLLSRWGIVSELVRHAPLGDLVVVAEHPGHLPPEGGQGILSYGALHNLVPSAEQWTELRRCNAVLWTGGLDLQDDSSRAKLIHLLLVFVFYRLLGLRIVCAMQGAGPLHTRSGRWLARKILARVECFIARDPGTARLLEELDFRGHLLHGSDGIFLGGFPGRELDPEEERAVARRIGTAGDRPVIGVNLRMWFHFSSSWIPYRFSRSRYRERAAKRMARLTEAYVQLIRELRGRRDARILLLSMYEPRVEDWEDDQPWLEGVHRQFGGDPEVQLVTEDLTLPAFYGLIGRLDLVIGMRLHSTLTALRASVPAVHVSYTLKGKDIFDSLGLGRWVLDLEHFMTEPELAVRSVEQALDDPSLEDQLTSITDSTIAANREALNQCAALLSRSA